MLLVNLGTPDATDYWSMRRYLKEIPVGPPGHRKRAHHLVAAPERHHPDDAPRPQGPRLRFHLEQGPRRGPAQDDTRAQSEKLIQRLGVTPDSKLVIDWAMRYGNPSIADRIAALQAEGCERILLVPLYPQYAAATSATVCDKPSMP